MAKHYVPTEYESELLDSTRRRLGDNLSEFLLGGLGEPHHSRRRFAGRCITTHGQVVTHQLEVVCESDSGLPGGRDPLVMAVLLHFLWTGERGRDEVVFRDEAVLERLGWDDTREARLGIGMAIERYYNCAYRSTNRTPRGERGSEVVSYQVQKLVTGYDTTRELREGSPQQAWRSTVLYFTTKLSE